MVAVMPKPRGITPMFDGMDAIAFKPKDGKDRPGLYIEQCTHHAVRYVVEHWHYSGSMPGYPIWAFGVWLNASYIGVVIFAHGASNAIGSPYNLTQGVGKEEILELVRVALNDHSGIHVSRINSIAIRLLKKAIPSLRLLVSYADPNHDHVGGIYQAGNWIYVGQTSPDYVYTDQFGNDWHSRMVSASGVKTVYGHKRLVVKPMDCTKTRLQGKYKYLYPLDDAIRKQVEYLRKPYPRVTSVDSDTTDDQSGKRGAVPTVTLQ
jgi:hypothetical protein